MDIILSIGLIIVSVIIGFIVGASYAYRDVIREANHFIMTGKFKDKVTKKGKK